MVNTL